MEAAAAALGLIDICIRVGTNIVEIIQADSDNTRRIGSLNAETRRVLDFLQRLQAKAACLSAQDAIDQLGGCACYVGSVSSVGAGGCTACRVPTHPDPAPRCTPVPRR